MKVSIETINNKLVTVIRKPFDAEWVKEQLSMGIPVDAEENGRHRHNLCRKFGCDFISAKGGAYGEFLVSGEELKYTLTILPPLSKHPKPEDAGDLYAYAKEGLMVEGLMNAYVGGKYIDQIGGAKLHNIIKALEYEGRNITITHATLEGERVEIAIMEE